MYSPKHLFFALCVLFISVTSSAQIRGRLLLAEDQKTYEFYVIPNFDQAPPSSTTNSAQISLRAPLGGLQITNFQSITGNWQGRDAIVIDGPVENPEYSYISIPLASAMEDVTYKANEEILLFTFQNGAECLGNIEVVDNDSDPFMPPNSRSVNLGNLFVIFSFGPINGYEGTEQCCAPCPEEDTMATFPGNNVRCQPRAIDIALNLGTIVTGQLGPPPYEVSWLHVESGDGGVLEFQNGSERWLIVENPDPGTYEMTIKSSEGTREVMITETRLDNSYILAPEISSIDVNCRTGSSGRIEVTLPNNRTSPYSYAWSNGAPDISRVTNLGVGEYMVTVTDRNGCSVTETATIGTTEQLAIDSQQSDASCAEATNGEITISVDQSGDFDFQWEGDGVSSTQNVASNLAPGNYTVTVSGQGGACTATESFTIGIDANYSLEPQLINTTDVNCRTGERGKIEVTIPQNPNGNYTYQWSNGAIDIDQINNLDPGEYIVTVTDNDNGCMAMEIGNIGISGQIRLSTEQTDASCAEATNGEIIIDIDQVENFNFQWEGNGISSTTNTASNLAPGEYSITVSDRDDICTITETFTIGIDANYSLEPQLNVTNVNCRTGERGNIEVAIPSNPNGDYAYQWSDGSPDAASINDLIPDEYIVTVTDNDNGCTATTTGNIGISGQISLSAEQTDASCAEATNGEIIVTIDQATNFNFQWEGNGISSTTNTASNLAPGEYSITVSDPNDICTTTETFTVGIDATYSLEPQLNVNDVNCRTGERGSIEVTFEQNLNGNYAYQWSDGSPDAASINDLIPNEYILTVTDNDNGCTAMATGNIGISGQINLSTEQTDASCAEATNGEIIVSVEQAANFNFQWEGNGISSTTNTASNLAPGAYSLTVSDQSNICTTTESFTIGIDATYSLEPQLNVNDVNCRTGERGDIEVTFQQNDNGDYDYQWSNGSLGIDLLSNLEPGEYMVTVTDNANGCTAMATGNIGISGQINIADVEQSNVTCQGLANGSIAIILDQPDAFNFQWEGNGISSTSSNIADLAPGDYAVTISDQDNICTTMESYTIEIDNDYILAPNLMTENVDCSTGRSGSVAVSFSQDTGPYSYQWSDGSPDSGQLNNLLPNDYTVTITDNNGCTTIESTTISMTGAIGFDVNQSDITCSGLNNGELSALLNQPDAFNVQWSGNGISSTEGTISELAPGNYTLNISDQLGVCTATESYEIIEIEFLTFDATYEQSDVTCMGANDGEIAVSIEQPESFSFRWEGNGISSTESNITNLAPGNYTVTVSNMNGACTETQSFQITGPTEPLQVNAQLAETDICQPSSSNMVMVNATGTNQRAVQYAIDNEPFSGNNSFTVLTGASYEIRVMDEVGCTASTSIDVPETSRLAINVPEQITLKLGEDMQLDVDYEANSPVTIRWEEDPSLSCTDCLNPIINPTQTTTYTFIISDDYGCSQEAAIIVFISNETKVFTPTAFSPNNDGINDFFNIFTGSSVEAVRSLQVYNRWGDQVFQSSENFIANDNETGWNGYFNGRMADPGVYVFFADVLLLDGTSEIIKGEVNLLR